VGLDLRNYRSQTIGLQSAPTLLRERKAPLRKLLGYPGEFATVPPVLQAAKLILVAFSVILLTLPNAASAQIWVSSGFTAGSDAHHATASCSTSAISPTTGQTSPAATDYKDMVVRCSVTTSTGAYISFPACAFVNPPTSACEGGLGTPTSSCSYDLPIQNGVT